MPSDQSSRVRSHVRITYRDPKGRVWEASEIAQIRVVAPAIDRPNICLVIRFEHEGDERFATGRRGAVFGLLRLEPEAEYLVDFAPDDPNTDVPPAAVVDSALQPVT